MQARKGHTKSGATVPLTIENDDIQFVQLKPTLYSYGGMVYYHSDNAHIVFYLFTDFFVLTRDP